MRAAIAIAALWLLFPAAPAEQVRAGDIIAHLARTIAWYRNVTAMERSAEAPGDRLTGENVRRGSTRALQLAFDFARAAVALASAEQPSGGAGAAAGKNVEQAAARAAERVAKIEARIAEVNAALGQAGTRRGATLAARRRELLAELNLAKQIQETVHGLRTFLSGQSAGSAGLLGYIERLERSVPEAVRGAQTPPAPGTAAEVAFRPESAGIFSLATEAIRLKRSQGQVRATIGETDTLLKNLDQLRAPLAEALRSAIRRSDAAANDSASQDTGQLEADRREIEALTVNFKQVSAALVPLREQRMLVETARGSLVEWRDSMEDRAGAAAGYLFLRAIVLVVAVLAVLGISELWRRGTFRYVRDARRRRQFLLLRRIVVTFAVVLALVLALVNEFGSLATYAGFLTAGLAFALQNVILSIVAYFFLIGRYGLRVGDRVTISGVTGDVVEIGLVRLYLMEMAGRGADLNATGRVVVFSNSVLFQPAAMFKQMPGTDYVWHTVAVTLAPDSDFELAENRLMAAVDSVYEEYRERIEQQHAAFQRLVDVPVSVPRPQGRLRFTAAGLEFTVRFPAEIRNASATDDQIMKALCDAIAREPRLPLAGAGAPKLQEAG